jgi:hypothetical protein
MEARQKFCHPIMWDQSDEEELKKKKQCYSDVTNYIMGLKE